MRISGNQLIACIDRGFSVNDVVEIPVGEYWIGDDLIPNAGPRHRRNLHHAAWIDSYPVTWAHFEVFVAGGGYNRELLERSKAPSNGACSVDDRVRSLLGHFSQLTGQARFATPLAQPISGLTWFEASAVASFFGARLPYEVEWEIAHSGTYKHNVNAQNASVAPGTRSQLGCTVLIGRLQEWTLDAFSNKYWRADFEKRGIDWSAENSEAGVTVRGAGPENIFRHLSYRFMSAATDINAFRGFRRVWDKKPAVEEVEASWRQ